MSASSCIPEKRWPRSQSTASRDFPCPATSCPQCAPHPQRLLSPGHPPAGQLGHPGPARNHPQAGEPQLHPGLPPGSAVWAGDCCHCRQGNKYPLLPQASGRKILQFEGSGTRPTCTLGLRRSGCLCTGTWSHTWLPATKHPSHLLCRSSLLPALALRTSSVACAKQRKPAWSQLIEELSQPASSPREISTLQPHRTNHHPSKHASPGHICGPSPPFADWLPKKQVWGCGPGWFAMLALSVCLQELETQHKYRLSTRKTTSVPLAKQTW